MKLVKSLVLGSAAALVTMTGVANAADLPGAEPVDYVKVCDIKGSTGFFYIPGTETCLQIGGFARLEMTSGEVLDRPNLTNKKDEFNQTGYRVRARVWFDARTDTEYGALRTFVRLQFQRETGTANTTDRRAQIQNANFGDDALFDQAFVQFAGLTAGVTDSFWDFKPYTTFQNPFISDRTLAVLAYTMKVGDFSASVSLEDKTARYFSTNDSLNNAGQQIPDIVANLRVKQGWGEAQLSGVLHRIEPGSENRLVPVGSLAGTDKEWGWGVQGGVKLNLPTANTSDAKGDFIWAQAAYTDGAGVSYNGLTDNNIGSGQTQNIVNNFQPIFDWVGVNGKVQKTQVFNANLGVLHYWSPKWRSTLQASYAQVKYNNAVANAGIADDWKAGTITGNLVWSPVKKLDIGGEVVYVKNLKKADVGYTGPKDKDAFIGRLRVQRDF
ncbi:porin [Chenggangzhangella methanolivorans]|uniref:Porin n=1 Tax=Chenggangzhangella methanolivorans TaxID=1437009 RepID=A0A9E6RB93_9HYPH|nr:porin [Chenggangzhangella methanolivorans]QZO00129.1 porin [Chenggangzhangella methanolivorans]